jgi:hypothetical protein
VIPRSAGLAFIWPSMRFVSLTASYGWLIVSPEGTF